MPKLRHGLLPCFCVLCQRLEHDRLQSREEWRCRSVPRPTALSDGGSANDAAYSWPGSPAVQYAGIDESILDAQASIPPVRLRTFVKP
jgi:hypothetical protein